MFASVDLLTNICLRTLALLSKIIFIVGTSPIVCSIRSTVSALPAAVLDQQVPFCHIQPFWIADVKAEFLNFGGKFTRTMGRMRSYRVRFLSTGGGGGGGEASPQKFFLKKN